MHNTWLAALVAKHARKGVLVDANLLVVYCIGSCGQGLIKQAKPTKQYTVLDFQLLEDLLGRFSTIITTPNILTEVSNLVGRVRDDIREMTCGMIKGQAFTIFDERYVATKTACESSIFARLGLSDAVMATLAEENILVLTNDLDLKLHLEYRGNDVIHYDSMLRPLTFEQGETT